MRLIGAGLAVIILVMGVSCGSKKKGLTKSELTLYHQHASESTARTRSEQVEHFGDTLRGSVPLPFQQPKVPGVQFPYRIPVSSSGLDLEIILDSASISYTAVAKPTSRTEVQETETASQENNLTEAVLTEETETMEKKKGVSWWLILIGVLLILLAVGCWILKIKFKPF